MLCRQRISLILNEKRELIVKDVTEGGKTPLGQKLHVKIRQSATYSNTNQHTIQDYPNKQFQ